MNQVLTASFALGSVRGLFRLAVRLMFPAIWTELLQLQPLSCGSLILRLAVVPVFAFCALELDNFTRHSVAPLVS